MVGHILQYHPAVIRLKALVRDGELGKIQYIYSNRLNIGKLRTEEFVIRRLWLLLPPIRGRTLGMPEVYGNHSLSVWMGFNRATRV